MRNTARQTRENRTITVDCRDEATYFRLIADGKAFVECVLAFLLTLGLQLKHQATCDGGGCLMRHSHDVRVRRGHRDLVSPVHEVSSGVDGPPPLRLALSPGAS
jgi:hypothetical protein